MSSIWLSTAPMSQSEASVCSMNGLSTSGLCSTGEEHNSFFSLLNALLQAVVHLILLGASFLVKSVRGSAIMA